jgi:hypothetical protein
MMALDCVDYRMTGMGTLELPVTIRWPGRGRLMIDVWLIRL